MAKRGVATLFFETSNYQMRAGHRAPRPRRRASSRRRTRTGLQIVAWYLPSFRDLARDMRRSLAAINFTTARRRAVRLVRARHRVEPRAVGGDAQRAAAAALAAAARGRARPRARRDRAVAARHAAPAVVLAGLPVRAARADYDVFLPMGYFTYRKHSRAEARRLHAAQHQAAAQRNRQSCAARAPDRRNRRLRVGEQVRAFVRAARNGAAIGASLYDFASTTPRPVARAAAGERPA